MPYPQEGGACSLVDRSGQSSLPSVSLVFASFALDGTSRRHRVDDKKWEQQDA